MRICSVTVLYNPEPIVVDQIESYFNYVERCIVVDNSLMPNEGIYNALRTKFPAIEIISNYANLGIGEGYNIGFRYAIAQDFEWVLTMDQDSAFKDSSFFDYAKSLKKDNIAIVSPDQFIKEEARVRDNDYELIDELDVMASGNLVRLSDWQEIGGFNAGLFIDEVDNDFCLRLKLAGKRVVKVKNCFLFHNLGFMKTTWSGREFHFHSPFRYYYMYRNFFYMKDKYEKDFPEWIAKKSKYKRKLPKYILFYGDHKFLTFNYMIKGYLAYKRGEMGPFKG